jgi:hypothetical protein
VVQAVTCQVKGCKAAAVVIIHCRRPPLDLHVCQHHPATVIWWIKHNHPGHGGVTTKSIKKGGPGEQG